MYKVLQNALKTKKCHVVILTGKAIRRYTLPKSDLGATTAKRQLLIVLRYINFVAGCGFKSYAKDLIKHFEF